MTDEFATKLNRLAEKCQKKRNILLAVAARNLKRKNMLSFLAGFLSILSAMTLTAAIISVTPPLALQMISVILAACGGILALAISFIYKDGEISNIHLGSSSFLELREAARYITMTDPGFVKAESQNKFSEVMTKYTTYSATYDKYMLDKIAKGDI